MDEADRQRYETQSKELRVKLKEWELEFAKSHGGAKPTRDDIKANPKIASYSKRYHRLRDVLSGKIPYTQLDGDGQDKKRKPLAVPSNTPSSKRFRPAETPSSRQKTHTTLATPHGPAASAAATTAAEAATPSLSRKLFSPTVPTSIGPTPQRDGRVLGLFDLLPFKDAEIDSPSRPKRTTKAPSAADAVQETPRRGRTIDTGVGIPIDLDRTPSSRSTRHQQPPQEHPQQTPRKSVLSTPLKDRSNRVAKTPSSSRSVSKLQFQTPAFLRRIPMSKISENNEFASPEPIRLPRKPLVRGLSSIVADLRKTQEQELDDELDALREMENDSAPAVPAKKPSAAPPSEVQPAAAPSSHTAREDDLTETILAEDSQKQNLGLLGGFDDEGMYDSEDDQQEGLDQHGMPLRVFKKKGQKRTTRKANMKPVMTRRPPAEGSDPEPAHEGDDGTVSETQRGKPAPARPGIDEDEDADLLSGSDYYDDEDELALDEPRLAKKAVANTKKKTAPSKRKQGGDDGVDKPEGKVKKAARKVNELAHANFKRLKLRNSGAKGGQGFNSRFRRRR